MRLALHELAAGAHEVLTVGPAIARPDWVDYAVLLEVLDMGALVYVVPGFHIASDPRASKGLKVATDSYAYTVAEDEDLSRCLVSWHWHPASRPDTHIHFGRGPGAWEGAWESFGRYHVPSGRVLFEDVVRFLIEDLGVTAQREDWSQVVEDVRQNVKQVWSWA